MIEGLKVTITGREIAEHCLERAEYHAGRANAYEKQIAALGGLVADEGTAYTSNDPRRGAQDKIAQHTNRAAYFKFVAAHIVAGEDYLLNDHELVAIEIAGSRAY